MIIEVLPKLLLPIYLIHGNMVRIRSCKVDAVVNVGSCLGSSAFAMLGIATGMPWGEF